MNVIASLRKRTKSGVSTWTFCVDREMKVHYAIGGKNLKVIRARDEKHLHQIFDRFLGFGYTRKLAPVKPQASTLPEDLSQQLWDLDPTFV